MKRRMPIILCIAVLLLAGCSAAQGSQTSPEGAGKSVPVPGGSYIDISATELQAMLSNKDFTFVNVHIPFEGNIANTDLSIPYNEIDQNLDKLPADKDAKIVLYCRSDRMSRMAAETLVGLGYTNVWNLDGGMVAWEQAGLSLEK